MEWPCRSLCYKGKTLLCNLNSSQNPGCIRFGEASIFINRSCHEHQYNWQHRLLQLSHRDQPPNSSHNLINALVRSSRRFNALNIYSNNRNIPVVTVSLISFSPKLPLNVITVSWLKQVRCLFAAFGGKPSFSTLLYSKTA